MLSLIEMAAKPQESLNPSIFYRFYIRPRHIPSNKMSYVMTLPLDGWGFRSVNQPTCAERLFELSSCRLGSINHGSSVGKAESGLRAQESGVEK